jgi:iron complex outermembrane receptor protein
LRAAQGGADRATVRASSVLHFRADAPTHGTLTFSLEHSTMRENSVSNPPITPNAKSSVVHGMVRDLVSWQNSTGFTTQANTVLNNSFFATTGIRFERDSRLVGADELVALPMIGGAAVQDYGPFNVKLRAAYGKGIRPPSALGHVQFWQMQNGWLTDQALGPEEQSGTEVGLDVYFRHALSLQITRFDQYASGLIQQVAVPADSAMESRRVTYVLQNVGEISNRGWELGATGAVSRLSVAGTLSFVDSRVTKLAAGYTGDLLTGDRMPLVPASTGSLTFTWNARQWYASLGGSRALDWINYDELSLTRAFMSGTRTARQMLGTQLRQYWRKYNGGLRLRATASRDIRDGFSIEFSADNLLNYQRDEPDNITVLPGRSLMTGIRVKF